MTRNIRLHGNISHIRTDAHAHISTNIHKNTDMQRDKGQINRMARRNKITQIDINIDRLMARKIEE